MVENTEGAERVLPNAWSLADIPSLFLGTTQQTFKGTSLSQALHLIVGGSEKSEIGMVFALWRSLSAFPILLLYLGTSSLSTIPAWVSY